MRAGSTAIRAGRHALQATIEALLVVAIIVSLAFAAAVVTGAASPTGAGSVLAAKGGNGGGGNKPGGSSGGTLSLVLLDSTDGFAHYGQRVDFDVSTTATDKPNVRVNCYEGGVWVYTDMTGKYEGYPWPGHVFTLKWDAYHTAGAAAECTASLFYFTRRGEKTLATTSFPVYP